MLNLKPAELKAKDEHQRNAARDDKYEQFIQQKYLSENAKEFNFL
jgi:hypothetical protein